MTISQALRRISKLKGQLKTQLDRAQAAVTHREDAPPAFSFGDSLEQADSLTEELVKLETALRVTNAISQVVGVPMTLAEAICRLSEYKARIAWLKELSVRAQADTKDQAGFIRATDGSGVVQAVTVGVKCHMPEATRAAAMEKAQAAFDALNDAVETTNHRTDLK